MSSDYIFLPVSSKQFLGDSESKKRVTFAGIPKSPSPSNRSLAPSINSQASNTPSLPKKQFANFSRLTKKQRNPKQPNLKQERATIPTKIKESPAKRLCLANPIPRNEFEFEFHPVSTEIFRSKTHTPGKDPLNSHMEDSKSPKRQEEFLNQRERTKIGAKGKKTR